MSDESNVRGIKNALILIDKRLEIITERLNNHLSHHEKLENKLMYPMLVIIVMGFLGSLVYLIVSHGIVK